MVSKSEISSVLASACYQDRVFQGDRYQYTGGDNKALDRLIELFVVVLLALDKRIRTRLGFHIGLTHGKSLKTSNIEEQLFHFD